MNLFLLLCDVFSFIFWKKLKTPKRHFRNYLTFSIKVSLLNQICLQSNSLIKEGKCSLLKKALLKYFEKGITKSWLTLTLEKLISTVFFLLQIYILHKKYLKTLRLPSFLPVFAMLALKSEAHGKSIFKVSRQAQLICIPRSSWDMNK